MAVMAGAYADGYDNEKFSHYRIGKANQDDA